MQIRPTAFTIGLIIHPSIALFSVYTEFGIDSSPLQNRFVLALTFRNLSAQKTSAEMPMFFLMGYSKYEKT